MGDAEHGRVLFKRMCALCHSTEKNGSQTFGPNLHGIVGKTSGSTPGFSFSEALKSKGIVWDEKNLSQYLENPRKFIPGTHKIFPKLKKEQDRKDVIAYLATLK